MSARKVNLKNLKRLCWQRGISVKELARRIGRSRMNVYRAVKEPHRFKPTYQLLEEALCE